MKILYLLIFIVIMGVAGTKVGKVLEEKMGRMKAMLAISFGAYIFGYVFYYFIWRSL